jgi:SRSO17 transposase
VRRHGRAYLLGLLSQSERKNSWQLAEFAGDASPDGMQRLLNFSPWDEDAARDAVARYVVRAMGDPAAVLAVDETGFLKKGRMSAGVARMYTGTAGRVENCQVGVFAAYVTPDGGRALVDRELYLPEKWTGDRDRCRAAGIGDDVAFATKPELAWTMISRARAAGVPFAWAAGDEVYGGNPGLRARLEEAGIPYVMATACSDVIAMAAGGMRADAALALVPTGGWHRLSCADGSKGPRLYDWALIGTAEGPGHHLLVRRSLQPGEKGQLELAFFRCWSPRPVTLPELAAVAGARWGIEDCFAEPGRAAAGSGTGGRGGPGHHPPLRGRGTRRAAAAGVGAGGPRRIPPAPARPQGPQPGRRPPGPQARAARIPPVARAPPQ